MAALIERTKVSVPQLAKEWGIGTTKIHALIKQGELRAINIATVRDKRPRYLIDRRDIEQFERSREVQPDTGPAVTRIRRRRAGDVKSYF